MMSYCSKGCSPKAFPSFTSYDMIRPDRDVLNRIPQYVSAAHLNDMLLKDNGAGIDKSGGYHRIGPDIMVGYSGVGSNSGSYHREKAMADGIAAARDRYDWKNSFQPYLL